MDDSLADYCERMKLSSINKMVAIMLCVALLLALWVGYYLLYLRHRLNHRYALEQVLEINRRALAVPANQHDEREAFLADLVGSLTKEVNELVALDVLGMAMVAEDGRSLLYAFSASEEDEEAMKEEMLRTFE